MLARVVEAVLEPAPTRRTSTCSPFTRSPSHPPTVPAHSSQDVAIADIAKVTALLSRAERLHTALPRGPQADMGHRAQLGKRSAVAARRARPAAGAVDLARPAPPVGRRRGARRLAVPDRPLPRSESRDPDRRHASRSRVPPVSTAPGSWAANPTPWTPAPSRSCAASRFPSTRCAWTARTCECGRCSMRPDQPVLLQRQVRGRAWRTIASLRADRASVLDALVPLRRALTLRVIAGALLSAPAPVPADRSRP